MTHRVREVFMKIEFRVLALSLMSLASALSSISGSASRVSPPETVSQKTNVYLADEDGTSPRLFDIDTAEGKEVIARRADQSNPRLRLILQTALATKYHLSKENRELIKR